MRIITLFAILAMSAPATAGLLTALDQPQIDRTSAVLGVMGYTVVPDLTTSTLSIASTDTGNPHLTMSQLAGGFTLSRESPLYMEGGLAYSRYDPVFLFSNGGETTELALKWTSIMLTAGVGWDFRLSDHLILRPIANAAYGHLTSDVRFALRALEKYTDATIEALNNSQLDAAGYGGSLMLDYEDYRPSREIDIEWRYSHVRLENIDSSELFTPTDSHSISTSLWARWRAPTGLTALHRPVRYVLEAAHSRFFGDQANIGFDALNSLGIGLELDSSHYDIIVSRTRLVFRYRFGEDVEGTAVGLAVSF